MSKASPRPARAAVRPGPLADLARLVSARRHRLGLTQQQLADLAGVSPSSVRAFETADPGVGLGIATSILAALGMRLWPTAGTSAGEPDD